MNKKHYIIITDNIIEDIETIFILPNEYKEKLKALFLSKDMLNINLATEIICTISKIDFCFIDDINYSKNLWIKDPARVSTLTKSF